MARYQYETSPRKLQPSQDYRNKKKNNSNKKKSNVHKNAKVNNSKIILAIGIAFVILFAINATEPPSQVLAYDCCKRVRKAAFL